MPGGRSLSRTCHPCPPQFSVQPFWRHSTWFVGVGIITIQARCETVAERLSRIKNPAFNFEPVRHAGRKIVIPDCPSLSSPIFGPTLLAAFHQKGWTENWGGQG